MKRHDALAALLVTAALAFLAASMRHYQSARAAADQARSALARQAASTADAARRAAAEAARLSEFAESYRGHPPAYWQARLRDAAARHHIALAKGQPSDLPPSPLAAQRLDLRFTAPHEGRLLDFIDDLRDTPAALVVLQACDARRTTEGDGLAVHCVLDIPHGPPPSR